MDSYVELFAGPEYLLHYKYSNIINMVCMTFMFGAGIPILFPITLGAITVIYILERLLVAYFYR